MKKKILALILAITCLLPMGFKSPIADAASSTKISVPYQSFVDVSFESKNSAYISMASILNIMTCSGNDYFKPNKALTKNEVNAALYIIQYGTHYNDFNPKDRKAVTIGDIAYSIWTALDKHKKTGFIKNNSATFNYGSDYDNAWAYCTSNGIISSSLRKDKVCSRAEGAIIFVRYYLFLKGVDISSLSLQSTLTETDNWNDNHLERDWGYDWGQYRGYGWGRVDQ